MAKFYTYDSAADIARCLSCDKKECTNCLGNFYSAADAVVIDDKAEGSDRKC